MFFLKLRLVGPITMKSQWEALDWMRRMGLPDAGQIPGTDRWSPAIGELVVAVPEQFARDHFDDDFCEVCEVPLAILRPGEVVMSGYWQVQGNDRLGLSPTITLERAIILRDVSQKLKYAAEMALASDTIKTLKKEIEELRGE